MYASLVFYFIVWVKFCFCKESEIKKLDSMEIIEKHIHVRNYVTKSNLPASDYVINPYVGCPHGCKYCYASFMKRFTGHKEEWGTFIDIKQCDKKINVNKLEHKKIFLSSVTDCYNQFEEKYQLTRNILKQIVNLDCELNISTKSKLILRDLDLLRSMKNLTVSISINTLDENFKNDMDHASSIQDRLHALKELHYNGIYTVLFMSPIFPYITNFKEIIEVSKEYTNEYWFENLNLRGDYKRKVLSYIQEKYPEFIDKYNNIYMQGNKQYWVDLSKEIQAYCENNHVKYINYFYHEQLVANKKNNTMTSC